MLVLVIVTIWNAIQYVQFHEFYCYIRLSITPTVQFQSSGGGVAGADK